MNKFINKFSIFNSQFSTQKGFSLIELLVSMGIFMTISTIVVSILVTSFRASKKSEVMIALKQSGDGVVSQMVRNIRYAASLDDPVSCVVPVTQSSITVTAFDGGQTKFSCPNLASTTISSNSASLVDTNSVVVSACSFTCSQRSSIEAPSITIQFTLSAVTSSNLVETTGSVPFQTSVTMRNVSR